MSSRESAQGWRDNYSTASTLSYTVAGFTALGAFVFPPTPIFLAAGSLGALGVGAAARASNLDTQAKALAVQEEEFNRTLDATELELNLLKDQLVVLDVQRSQYVQAKQLSENIQKDARKLRDEAQTTLVDLRSARIALSTIEVKIGEIATELHEMGYARSRRQMAKRLREVLNIIQRVGGKQNFKLDQKALDQTLAKLLRLDEQTPWLLELLGAPEPRLEEITRG